MVCRGGGRVGVGGVDGGKLRGRDRGQKDEQGGEVIKIVSKTKQKPRRMGGEEYQSSLEVDSTVLVEIELLEDPVGHVYEFLGEVELLHHGRHVLLLLQ